MSDQSVFSDDGTYLGQAVPIEGGGMALVDDAGRVVGAVDEHMQPINVAELQLDTGTGGYAEQEAVLQRIEQLEAQLAGDTQAEHLQQQLADLEETTEAALDELGIVSKEQRDAVVMQAVMDAERSGSGTLDVHAAHEALQGAHEAERAAYDLDHPDDTPPEDASVHELSKWASDKLEATEYGQVHRQRMAVEAGELDRKDADLLPAWEREGREPAGMEDGHPDPMTAEGQAYMAQQLADLDLITGEVA
jgi:hypothetical protein